VLLLQGRIAIKRLSFAMKQLFWILLRCYPQDMMKPRA
jgi:hypothetical protein